MKIMSIIAISIGHSLKNIDSIIYGLNIWGSSLCINNNFKVHYINYRNFLHIDWQSTYKSLW